jgi:23S rRNA pseudouridine2457 synthase
MTVLAFFKPYGVVTRFTGSKGELTLADYISFPGVYPAGRLDKDSEGLLLLTDDGELAHLITHPRHALAKVYLAQVERIPDESALAALQAGVLIQGVRTRAALAELLAEAPTLPERPVPVRYRKSVPTAWIRLTLWEGRNHQVRRMTAAVGHPTLRLVRESIGPVHLGVLQPGQWRRLDAAELRALRQASSFRGRSGS